MNATNTKFQITRPIKNTNFNFAKSEAPKNGDTTHEMLITGARGETQLFPELSQQQSGL